MGSYIYRVLFICLLLALFCPEFAKAQNCSTQSFSSNKLYATCNNLPVLGASLHWSYYALNGTADVAYRIPQVSSGWVAWAINTKSSGMIGANALFAFHDSTSGAVKVVSTVISDYMPTVSDGNLTFTVYNRSAEYSNGTYTIYARIEVPGNKTSQKIVWQAGKDFSGGDPSGHNLSPPNTLASTSIDFGSGSSVVPVLKPATDNRLRQKNIHGVLNAVAWGIILPLGVLVARYVKSLNPSSAAWFHGHRLFQCVGYVTGVAGFALGIKLASESKGITYHSHRSVGIAVLCLATLQVSALLLRPKPTHEKRIYWNIYHYTLGILVLTLGIVNVFKGFDILNPDKKWKHLYVIIICVIAGVTRCLRCANGRYAATGPRKDTRNRRTKPVNGQSQCKVLN